MTTDERIHKLAGKAIDARLALADAIRDACPKPHAYVQHRDHQPAWCNTCGRGENGVHYGPEPASRLGRDTDSGQADSGATQRLGCSLHGGVALATPKGGTHWIDCAPDVCGFICPDHPGSLDDARGHICRPRPSAGHDGRADGEQGGQTS